MVIALAPLVLVLYSVIAKGFKAITSSAWWTHSQAGMTAFVAGGGAYHAIVGTLLQGLVCAAISVPIGSWSPSIWSNTVAALRSAG